MPDKGLIDDKIRQELRSLEGTYNEADWQEIEPFVNTLEAPSSFNAGKTLIIAVICIFLGTGLYFAIPYARKMQDKKEAPQQTDSLALDTASTDPTVKPDTIPSGPVITSPPVEPKVDSSAIKAREDSIKASQIKPAEPVIEKKTEPTEIKPKKKKRQIPVKEETKPPAQNEPEEDDFLKKEKPIIAEPESHPETQQKAPGGEEPK